MFGSPTCMNIKLCAGVNPKEVYNMPSPNFCDICGQSSIRMVKCHEYGTLKKQAHPFCIMNSNKDLVYQVDCLGNSDFEYKI